MLWAGQARGSLPAPPLEGPRRVVMEAVMVRALLLIMSLVALTMLATSAGLGVAGLSLLSESQSPGRLPCQSEQIGTCIH